MRRSLFLVILLAIAVISFPSPVISGPPGPPVQFEVISGSDITPAYYNAWLDIPQGEDFVYWYGNIPEKKRFIIQTISGWGLLKNTNEVRSLKISRYPGGEESPIEIAFIPLGPSDIMYVDSFGYRRYVFHQYTAIPIDYVPSLDNELVLYVSLYDNADGLAEFRLHLTGYYVEISTPSSPHGQ